MPRFTRSGHARIAAVLGALVATLAVAGPAAPAQADDDIIFPPMVGLSVDAPNQLAGGVATLKAGAMLIDIKSSPYYVKIYDVTTQALIKTCGDRNVCEIAVSQNVATQHKYRAYISGAGSAFPPPSIQAISNDVTVKWGAHLVLNADRPELVEGETSTLTAKAAVPGPIVITDDTTGLTVKTCAAQFTMSCVAPVTNIRSTHVYHATQAGMPSNSVTVYWSRILS